MTTKNNKIIGITGSSGYLGKFLSDFFENQGFEVVRLSSKKNNTSKKTTYFELNKPILKQESSKFDVVIHCAWDMKLTSWNEIKNTNIKGSIDLFNHLLKQNVPNIYFISSSAAFKGCKSLYGKAKLEVEDFCIKNNIIVLRPGLIYDKNPKGMLGSLCKLSNISPLLPRCWPKNLALHLCHIEDIAKNLHYLIQKKNQKRSIQKPYIFAHKTPILFNDIISCFSNRNLIYFIYFPSHLIMLLLKTIEFLGLKFRIKSDSLISLLNQNKNLPFQNNPMDLDFSCISKDYKND